MSGIISIRDTALPYPVYVFTGTMFWSIFVDSVNSPLNQTTSAKAMLAKINFPREALLISGIYKTFFNSAIKIFVLLCALLFLGVYPGWGLIWFPIGVFSLILTGTAVGLLITPVGVLYTDIARLINHLLQILMYLTPVIFPMPTGGFAAVIYKFNPMTPLIMTTRNWLTGFQPQYLNYFFLINVFVVMLLIIVWIAYRAAMPILIERMSS